MGKVTAGEILRRVEEHVPNSIAREEKLRWLSQAEGMIYREILGDASELPAVGMLTMLTVESPYETLYERYVEAQLFYTLGEIERYNNAAAAWNGAYAAYKDYVNRNAAPEDRRRTLKIC